MWILTQDRKTVLSSMAYSKLGVDETRRAVLAWGADSRLPETLGRYPAIDQAKFVFQRLVRQLTLSSDSELFVIPSEEEVEASIRAEALAASEKKPSH